MVKIGQNRLNYIQKEKIMKNERLYMVIRVEDGQKTLLDSYRSIEVAQQAVLGYQNSTNENDSYEVVECRIQ